jgi:hypothetical protein
MRSKSIFFLVVLVLSSKFMRSKSIFFLVVLVLSSGVLPAFAEVSEVQLDKNSYLKGDSINVQGSVDNDTSGLVTIVLRDPNDKFVLLSQAFIQSDDSFEKIIPINDKFQVSGTYNATAFVLNMTAGKTQSFDFDNVVSEKNENFNDEISSNIEKIELILQKEDKIIKTDFEPKPKVTDNTIEKEPIIENQQKEVTENNSQIADFVDPNKTPEHYLDRYYNEPNYQAWFDKNYPNLTIEEAVGYFPPTETEIKSSPSTMGTKIIPEAEALSIGSPAINSESNEDVAQAGVVLGGLAVLFGAVYGIKRKVDSNSKHISLNKGLIRKKIFSSIRRNLN